ncbi:6-phosphogluconolactonase [Pseudomonas sp. NW5]|uniref:6-phosphogluconolactonase n=1 Tax=Pseudomonas sp. NW5 TaxID=2934934 RepID=UPI0020211B1A|nr:6-phosphogluconolactonase [Pseudomonas sp. NW5]MCL7461746.1 6-phosphogluconolactonase [Pseudomonas sp. NW5]
MPDAQWHCYADRTHCSQQLAGVLTQQLQQALSSGMPARLLLPGGQTPGLLLAELACQPLDWAQVQLSPTDERWVTAEDPASNLHLLQHALPEAQLLDPRQGRTPEEAAQCWCVHLRAWLPLQGALLGMGEDGHIASLFPAMPALAEALDPQAMPGALPGVAPSEPRQRLSVNLSLLLNSQWLGLLVFGEAKRRLLEAVQRGEAASLPVAALMSAAAGRLQIYWAP